MTKKKNIQLKFEDKFNFKKLDDVQTTFESNNAKI